ncbi:hypothetical protein SAY87_006611 [Trapa incisa]|uniref:S-protein homolog n=1 Tax=Trapa incisa TaxID=236973 RepID=A0AAN7PZT4_9MYRT|nr:hypothetical protein SAY87_006611 [Trapa incisa]
MMMHRNKTTLLFLFPVLWLCVATSSAIHITPKVYVEVSNQLPQSHYFVILYKSNEDKLGANVAPKQVYGFHFRPNIWGTTHFTCEVRTDYGTGTYKIYEYDRDHKRCGNQCLWKVTQSGVESANGNVPIIFYWTTTPGS